MMSGSGTQTGTVYRETVPGGRYWSGVVQRGFGLRLEDVTGRANVAVLLFNPNNLLERFNMADTLKGQHTSKLTRGNMLYSDMGRVMLSIVEDSLGWHDPIGGVSSPSDILQQYGPGTYQDLGNAFYRSGRELFLIELGKWGLGKQDLLPNVNFFSKVHADATGGLHFTREHSKAGAHVLLRAEMPTLVVLNTAPHPLDPSRQYQPGSVALEIKRVGIAGADDYCVKFRPENERAFENTQAFLCQENAS